MNIDVGSVGIEVNNTDFLLNILRKLKKLQTLYTLPSIWCKIEGLTDKGKLRPAGMCGPLKVLIRPFYYLAILQPYHQMA